jgi:hypothetical protein
VSSFVDDIVNLAQLKPKKESKYWLDWDLINLKDLNGNFPSYYLKNYDKYYGGHQFRLGHYYRNIFHILNYINKQKGINYDEKYEYLKMLRVHFSNIEQILLFINSLSSIGRDIEINKNDINDQLITKYNLIANIPNVTINNLSINAFQYYPFVDFEFFGNGVERGNLKKSYK